jgi:aldehyde:ferredoxin oxidoreductase
MGYGFTGKILRVNLSAGTVETETIDEQTYRLYPGGKALAGYYLLRELPAAVDPLGPENLLVLANGLLTGAPVATATRFTAAARSPLTGGYGESEAGGFWGPELKQAGFEAILITGRAPQPVFLWVKDEQAEIRPAEAYWGRHPAEVQAGIRQELGDERVRVLQIGVAGENGVRYASMTNELRHFNGRNGMGAVMGSKNLKAVAVRGQQLRYLNIASDPKSLAVLGQRLAKGVKQHPQSYDLFEKGTMPILGVFNAAGMLPTRNFQAGVFAGADQVRWERYLEELLDGRHSCFACAIRCKPHVSVDDRYQVSGEYGGPEYETVGVFGPNSEIADLQAIAKANELCDQYGLDTVSAGGTITFVMECFERRLLGTQETGGLDLQFGNAAAVLEALELIAYRRGFGDQMAEGSRRLAERLGGEAPRYAMQVKSQELPMHDPRGKVAVGIGYAVSEIGADHLVSFHDTLLQNPESLPFRAAQALGVQKALPPRQLDAEKARNYFILENWSSLEKALGLCYFGPAPRSLIQVQEVLEAVQAATGWEASLEELLQVGERATNLARIFNVREGFGRREDTLPERLFTPLPEGPLAGAAISPEEFEAALDALYEYKGWDPKTAAPTRARLEALKVGWAAGLMEEA